MSFPVPTFDVRCNDSAYRFHLQPSSEGHQYILKACRFDRISHSNDNTTSIGTKMLYDELNYQNSNAYTECKSFDDIFVKVLDNPKLDPIKIEYRIYEEAMNCFSRLQGKLFGRISEIVEKGDNLYVTIPSLYHHQYETVLKPKVEEVYDLSLPCRLEDARLKSKQLEIKEIILTIHQ